MNIERTKNYYAELDENEICDCEYCKNYREKIKQAYPELSEQLLTYGVDIEKPFETMPLEPDKDNQLEYIAAQYIVFGDPEKFENTTVSGVEIRLAESHPTTNIEEEHFVIELLSLNLEAWEQVDTGKQSEGEQVDAGEQSEETEVKKSSGMGFALGICLGVVYGIIYDDLALGIGFGLMFAMVFS